MRSFYLFVGFSLLFLSLWIQLSVAEKPRRLSVISPVRLPQFVQSAFDTCIVFCHVEEPSDDCQLLEKLVADLQPTYPDVKFGIYDIGQSPEFAEKFHKGSHVGQLVWYKNGNYHADRNYKNSKLLVSQWIALASENELKTLETSAEIQDLTNSCSNEMATIILFSTEKRIPAETHLLTISHEYEDIFQIRAVRDQKLIDKYSSGKSQIGLFPCIKTRSEPLFLDTGKEFREIQNWILKYGTPHISPVSTALINRNLDLFKVAIVVAIPQDQNEKIHNILNEITDTRNDVGFLYGSVDELRNQFINSGATGRIFPTAVCVTGWGTLPIAWDEKKPFTKENLNTWIDKIHSREVALFKKSAPIPPKTNSVIQPVVYDNFEDAVVKSKEPVLVLFTSSSSDCVRCPHTESQFQIVAERFKKKPIRFVTYDIRDNAQVIQSAVPSAYLYVKGTPILYDEPLPFSVDKIAAWLKAKKAFPVHDEF